MKNLIRSIDIKNWYDLLERKAKYSNYIDRDVKSQLEVLFNELKELEKAVDDNNITEVRKELLDVLFNQGQLLYSLQKKGYIDEQFVKTSGKQQKDKIFERSPFLKENKKVSVEEEEKLRYESKEDKLLKEFWSTDDDNKQSELILEINKIREQNGKSPLK